MQLDKDLKKNILYVYQKWLNNNLNGDVKTYDVFLDNDYRFMGSAAQEEFLNRKYIVKFFANTGDQFTGKTEIRNKLIIVEQFRKLHFISHILDGWFLQKKIWNFKSRFRYSSVLENTKDGWRFIYQHFLFQKDHAIEILKNSIDKIFQHLLTTKPTGKRTGLGLSLSYDTITKSQQGQLIVESKNGEGSKFSIKLFMNIK